MSFKLAQKLGRAFFGRKFRDKQIREYEGVGFVTRIGRVTQINYIAEGSNAVSVHQFAASARPYMEISASGKVCFVFPVRFTGRGFIK